jgi:hypothetical protein
MNEKLIYKKIGWFIPLAVLLLVSAACYARGGEAPQQIATYPKNPPIAIAPPLPEHAVLVYQLYLELQVSNVEAAAAHAEQLAYRHGGYLVSSQTWYVDSRQNTTLILAVPTVNFESLRNDLHSLGSLASESLSGEIVESYPRGIMPYSHITLHLRPGAWSLPPVPSVSGWNPARTFQNAFAVFVKVFGFLVDILIWLLVLVGPFALLFWLGFAMARRMRGRRPTNQG